MKILPFYEIIPKNQRGILMNMTSAAKEMPANIMLDKWADIGFTWSGSVPVSIFHRLSEQVSVDAVQEALQVQTTLQKSEGILWLAFEVMGQLVVPCQRCLDLMMVNVSGDYRLAILADETQIDAIQGAEYVLMDELDSGRMLPIKDLLEDELLLTLPLSPRHDECDMPIDMVDDEEEEVQENPFAALAALKGKLN